MSHRLRMFPDSGARWPFWEGGPGGPFQPTPQELGLSEELTAEIEEWMQYWRSHCETFLRWDSAANRQQFVLDAHRLRDRINSELGSEYNVVVIDNVY